MGRRVIPPNPSIGERIRTRRTLRRWSIRFAASRAGMSHTTWSRVEKGEQQPDRYTIAEFATALECSTTDLTGQPHMPSDRLLETAHARVERLWQSLLEIAPDEPPDRPVQPIEALTERVDLLDGRYHVCDYASTGQILPDLLRDLHAAMAGPDTCAASLLMVRATYVATFTLRYLGYVKDCAFAAERCRQAAERVDEPVPLAVADWVRAHAVLASGRFRRALTLTTRAADELRRHLDADTALEMLGMLHLTSALSVLAERRTADAFAHVAEAADLAARTGETGSWSMFFGPANVGIWRVGLEVDAGEPGRAVQTAAGVNPAGLPSMTRQGPYYLDLGRALAAVDRDQDAERMLLTAERLAPQFVRSSTSAQTTARFLLERSRRRSALHGLCERMGMGIA
jgi:transcriptional regulator with XRE-family HTH domain